MRATSQRLRELAGGEHIITISDWDYAFVGVITFAWGDTYPVYDEWSIVENLVDDGDFDDPMTALRHVRQQIESIRAMYDDDSYRTPHLLRYATKEELK